LGKITHKGVQWLSHLSVGFFALSLVAAAPALARSAQSAEGVVPPTEAFPELMTVIEQGFDRHLHAGVQVYVSIEGSRKADFGMGLAGPNLLMTPDTRVPWFDAVKPITSVAVLQLWDRGEVGLDDPVTDYLPGLSGAKAAITVRHLLTHSVGLPQIPDAAQTVEDLSTLSLAWTPGKKRAYHDRSAHILMAGLIAKLSKMPYEDAVQAKIFKPMGIQNTVLAMATASVGPEPEGDREPISFASTFANDDGKLIPGDASGDPTQVIPGMSGYGPMRDLGLFYEVMMLGGGPLLTPQSAELATSYQVVLPEEGTRRTSIPAPEGLGFMRQEAEIFGAYRSERAFGHVGDNLVLAFADPEHDLVVAVFLNGRLQDRNEATARFVSISNAIYEDLKLGLPE